MRSKSNSQCRMRNMRVHTKFIAGAVARILVVLSVVMAIAPGARSQYFGRNKIQYQLFNFEILQTKHIDLYHYPPVDQAATDAAAMAERWYARYAHIFNHQIKGRQPIILYANHPDFAQTNAISGLISQGTGGVTEGLERRMVLPLTDCYAEDNHVIGHELVHAFQYSMAESHQGGGQRGLDAPLWFIEGMAEYMSLGHNYTLTSVWMRDAVLHDDIPTIDGMSNSNKYFPYRWGHEFWMYVTDKYGQDMPSVLLRATLRTDWHKAFKDSLGISVDSLSTLWKQYIRDNYGKGLDSLTSPDSLGRPLLKNQTGIVLSPSVSPDGRYVAFIGQRDLFTLDLFLADVQTGQVLAKLASSGTDAHFDAIQFTNSAGTWSPDGKQLAFVVVDKGDSRISIVDVASRQIKKTFAVKGVDAIFHLAWSPDGRQLALSASSGGIDDLYLYDLASSKLHRLTNDRYAQLQPSWSPDGKQIAFMTDRGAPTDMSLLNFRKMQIAVLDLQTMKQRFIAISDKVRHSNPAFESDGNLLLVADPGGFPNIYRYNMKDSTFQQLTDVATGITGLTSLSPCLSVASKKGVIACTVFDKGEYKLRIVRPTREYKTLAEQQAPSQYLSTTQPAPTNFASVDSADNIDTLMTDPALGLPDTSTFKNEKYHPDLDLIYAGQSVIGIGVDQFGTYLGGGASFLYSDILGNHQLGLTVQSNGGLKDLGGEVMYENLRRRWNWGASVGHIPYLTGYVTTTDDTATVNGQTVPVLRQDLIRERVYDDRAAMLADYPLTPNRRFEFTGGFSHISYSADRESIFSNGGYVLGTETQSLPAPSSLNLAYGSISYVGDYSYFGFTSPARGSRYRLEVEPTFGSLTYATVLADYRKYFFINPVTIAFRGLHIGRYFGDANSDRLSPLYLGFETLVRGYSVGSIDLSECSGPGCPVYDRLVGTRLGVFNAEVRLPVLGTAGYGLVNWPYLPTELAAFFDGGVAWSAGDPPKFKITERSNERIPVFSAGGAIRINFFGFLVGQFYYAFPFQRPDKTGQFGFVIAPGW